jgi:hypothetical protein
MGGVAIGASEGLFDGYTRRNRTRLEIAAQLLQ